MSSICNPLRSGLFCNAPGCGLLLPGLLFLMLLGLAVAAGPAASASESTVSAIDDEGRRVSLAGPARRVISLSPALTEMVFAAGGGASLAGVVEHSDYPASARHLPRVGDALVLQMERILQLQPDLVLAWQRGNNPRQLERLAQLGVPVFYSHIERLEDVASTLERLGVLMGTPAAGAVQDYRRRLARLVPGVVPRPGSAPVRVFYQVWEEPLMTVSGRHVISDLIGRCGGLNVFAAETALVPRISIEAVIAAAPEAIIASAGSRTIGSDRSLAHWRRYGGIPAVGNGFLFLVDGDSISRATPRMLDAGEAICRHLDAVRRAR